MYLLSHNASGPLSTKRMTACQPRCRYGCAVLSLHHAHVLRYLALPGRGRWLGVFALFFLLLAAWSLATAPITAPDEAAHVFRAYSIWHGEVVNATRGSQGLGSPATDVTVSRALAELDEEVACATGVHPATRPCDSPAPSGPTTRAPSGAARYNPLYYALVGIPSVAVDGRALVYLMRLISIVLCSALCTTAFISACRTTALGGLGVLLALTPASAYLMGTVNPNGVEIAAALATWTLGVRLGSGLAEPPQSRVWIQFAVCSALLSVLRVISPLWLVIIWVVTLHRKGRAIARLLRHDRRAFIAGLIAIMGIAENAVWSLASGSLNIARPERWVIAPASGVGALIENIERSYSWWHEAWAAFGYLNWYFPSSLYGLPLIALAAFGVAVRPSRRSVFEVGLLVLLAEVISVALATSEYQTLGYWWQGRYTLPLICGVPILLLSSAARRPARTTVGGSRRLATLIVSAIVVISAVVGVAVATMPGLARTTWAMNNHIAWSMPTPTSALVLITATVMITLCVIASRNVLSENSQAAACAAVDLASATHAN